MSECDDRAGEELTTALDEESRDASQQEWMDRLPWWDEWAEQNRAYLKGECEAMSEDPEVRAILTGWDLGGTMLPWVDAGPEVKSSSDEKGQAA